MVSGIIPDEYAVRASTETLNAPTDVMFITIVTATACIGTNSNNLHRRITPCFVEYKRNRIETRGKLA